MSGAHCTYIATGVLNTYFVAVRRILRMRCSINPSAFVIGNTVHGDPIIRSLFIVYKEQGTNNWVPMDSIANNVGTWVDTTSHPQNSADSYKIGVEDTCSNIGAMSAAHTTINLIVSY